MMTGEGCQDILNASWERGRSERPGGGARSRATMELRLVPAPSGTSAAPGPGAVGA